MVIDRSHRRWAFATLAMLAAASGVFIWFASAEQEEWRAGSVVGIGFGIAASLLMLFEAALSVRKRLPGWRVGRVSTWMRAHIWLGLLTLPVVLYHANFRFGGLLEQCLMAVFLMVYVSGIAGLVLQQVLPWWMSVELPNEAIVEQIPVVRRRLLQEADRLVVSACGTLRASAVTPDVIDGRNHLVDLYEQHVRPLLSDATRAHRRRPSALKRILAQRFAATRMLLAEDLHSALEEVYRVMLHAFDLRTQQRMFFWLHSWLVLHMALTWALLILMAAHVVSALYY